MSRNRKSSNNNRSGASNKHSGKPQSKPEDNKQNGSQMPDSSVDKEKTDPKEADKEAADQRGKKNDPAWYAAFPELLFAAGNFPFSYPFGTPIRLAKHASNPVYENDSTYTWAQNDTGPGIPGILTLTIKDTVPGNGQQTDPINVAANAFYTHLRVVNAGRKNYDPVDAMMYNLAIAEVYSFIYFCQKLYGLGMQYSRQNFYIGEQLALELGVNWSDLLRNLANFRYWLNAYTKKMQAYAVPNSIPYYLRKTFMYAGVYLENEDGNIKDQLYQFKPGGFYKFELDSRSRGSLVYKVWSFTRTGQLATYQDIMAFGNSLISDIWGDEDFGLISGDIIKAYGSNLITVSEIPAEFTIYPVHDPYVLNQFRNARIYALDISSTYDYSTTETGCKCGNVYQDSNGLIFCRETNVLPAATWDSVQSYVIKHDAAALFVSSKANPEPSEVVEGTRLTVLSDGTFTDSNNKIRRALKPCCEIATSISYVRITTSGVQIGSITGNFLRDTVTLSTANVQMLFAFKYAPTVLTFKADGTTHEVSDIAVISNVDNYTIIDESQLSKLHEVCALSLFYVPGVAQFIASKTNA